MSTKLTVSSSTNGPTSSTRVNGEEHPELERKTNQVVEQQELAPIQIRGSKGTLLHAAVYLGDIDKVRAELEKKGTDLAARIVYKDEGWAYNGLTAYELAVYCNRLAIAKLLVPDAKEAKLYDESFKDWKEAAAAKFSKSLEKGEYDRKPFDRMQAPRAIPRLMAGSPYTSYEMAQWVLRDENKESINAFGCESDGFNNLHVACAIGTAQAVRAFLEKGASPNLFRSGKGNPLKQQTPVQLAIQPDRHSFGLNRKPYQAVEKVTLLVRGQADINLKKDGFQHDLPLFLAVEEGWSSEDVQFLIENGAEFDPGALLSCALSYNNSKVAQFLLNKYEINLNEQTEGCQSQLDLAVRNMQDVAIVKKMLAAGAKYSGSFAKMVLATRHISPEIKALFQKKESGHWFSSWRWW